MSSGTRVEMDASQKAISAASPRVMSAKETARFQRLGMSPRQQHLNELWRWYTCTIYDGYRCDWNGQEVLSEVETEAVVSAGFIPAGFYDAGQTLPLKFRKPETPSGMCKLIVDRFTGLLFSAKTHPRVRCAGDPDTEDFVQALVEEAKIWSTFVQVRNYGGGMGSVAVGFKFVDGTPRIEVHDPRWCRVEFEAGGEFKVARIEKRYIYSQEDFDEETGEWVTSPVWFRRIIDAEADTLYEPAWVGDGEEPEWEIAKQVKHGLGFCPVVWIQNLPVEDDIDGLPDAHGTYDLIGALDRITSQAHKGTISNCDPTLLLVTDTPLTEIQKGSDNAIQIPVGGAGKYMELTGESTKAALAMGERYRQQILELASVVLPALEEGGAGRGAETATAVERRFSAMLAKADLMRVQYGDRGLLRLVEMMVNAVRLLSKGSPDETGTMVRGTINLPPKVVPGENGQPATFTQHKLGSSSAKLSLSWPRYFSPSLLDTQLAVGAATNAKAAGLIDQEHAAAFVADHFSVEDVRAMLERVKKEANDRQAKMAQAAMQGSAQGRAGKPGQPNGQNGQQSSSVIRASTPGLHRLEGPEEV